MNAPLYHRQLRAPWQALLDGPAGASPAEFHAAWMECLVNGVGDVIEAVLVLADADADAGDDITEGAAQPQQRPMRPAAFWPAGRSCGPALATLCEEALAMGLVMSRNAVVPGAAALEPGANNLAMLAVPLLTQDRLRGVVALAFRTQAVPRHAQDWVRWGSGWLLPGGEASHAGEALRERLLVPLDLVMAAAGEDEAKAAMNAVVTEAAVRLGCDRVSLGLGKGRSVRLAALSHSADFSRRLDLARAIEASMNEAADQGGSLFVCEGKEPEPAPQQSAYAITRDHIALLRGFGTRSALSVPFFHGKRQWGVLLFEWAHSDVDPTRREIALGATPVLGRLLLDKRQAQRAWPLRLVDSVATQAGKLLGPRYVGRKLALIAIAAAAYWLATAEGEFRVPAKAALEGGVRRVIVAPFDGYVAGAQVRAGQEVKRGQLMASLDDRDVRLETSRWASQQAQYDKQMQDALAQRNLAQMQIAMAQSRQALAQRRLSESQLSRTRVEAPFDGIVVSGDLSQSLGAAVRKGQSLFEIAPLDSYRIVMEVEEGDIGHVREGAAGELMVAALPGQVFPFTVTLVTPVAKANEGRNHFRVEAKLNEHAARLRPGMEGIGKISAGERKKLWIWTHRATDWARLQVWNWFGV